jgi:hypothetical protein
MQNDKSKFKNEFKTRVYIYRFANYPTPVDSTL